MSLKLARQAKFELSYDFISLKIKGSNYQKFFFSQNDLSRYNARSCSQLVEN